MPINEPPEIDPRKRTPPLTLGVRGVVSMIDAQWCLFRFQQEDVGHCRRRNVDEASELGGSRASPPFSRQRGSSPRTAGLPYESRASASRTAQEREAEDARSHSG